MSSCLLIQPFGAGGQAEPQQQGAGTLVGCRGPPSWWHGHGIAGQRCPQHAAASSALAGQPELPGADRRALEIPAGALSRPQLPNCCSGSTEHVPVLSVILMCSVWPLSGAGGSVGWPSLAGREQLLPETSKTSQAWILKNSEHVC